MIENPLIGFFPQLANAANDVYLDNAATTHKPACVISRIEQFYRHENANVHRSSHRQAAATTAHFEQVRAKVQTFLKAAYAEEIIWTKGATESINIIANCLGSEQLRAGSRVVISALEHHANLVPWQRLVQRLNLHLVILPVDDTGRLQLNESLALIDQDTSLVAIGHVSNAFGNINPIEAIIAKSKRVGALTVIDGAQAVSHIPVDVQALDCDFYVFSGHKIYGPTGIGVLYGKRALLNALPPYQLGGEMIEKVTYQHSTFQGLPFKFEAGTPNIAGVLGLGAALEFVIQHRATIQHVEQQLYHHLISGLRSIEGIKLWGEIEHSVAVQSFTFEGISQQDLVILLNQQHIALRAGHHCTMPLMERLQIEGTLRVSLACYNSLEDIERFIHALNLALEQVRRPLDDKALPSSIIQTNKLPLAASISSAQGWDQTYRQIMLAGRDLTRLAAELHTVESEVHGCESPVWLKCLEQNDVVVIQGDSPSKIIRGLMAIIFEVLNYQTKQYILAFDLRDYLQQLGLANHLSESRGNGMVAMVNKIQQFCATANISQGT